ncbi:MAG TPA: alanine racemase C-terminal domain-containing protein, partial [Devosiaceae bacterium]|nr:alanine racemase C-terminal domain-containing protein [Devosiaceae bacterium]
APVVGRVSMDSIVADVTDLGENGPLPGEYAEVIGPNVSVDDHGDAGGTVGYEVLTALRGRYRRQYVNAPATASAVS